MVKNSICGGWLKDSSKYLNIEEPDDFNIRLRIAKYPELEECLAVWHSYQVSKNVPSKINKLEGVKQSKDRLSIAVIVNYIIL